MSKYTPLALKYRPRTLADLVGQEVLVRTMTHAIKDKRIYNAYLYVGDWGCGKTSAARIVAACLNSPGGESVSPKDSDEVRAIFEGRSADVIEMDAATNRNIDDIRDIKKDAQFRPVNGRWKVYIIDEAHALTPQAVQALLKTLEEPPEQVVFILCTTETHKIPNTILTRCQEFRFTTLPWAQIAAHLKAVCGKEGVQIEDDALKAIAKRADGHMRDALKHLDAVILFAGVGNPITADLARQALGVADESLYFDLITAVLEMNLAAGIRVVQSLLGTGQTAATVVNGALDHLRTLLVIGACESTAGIVTLTQEEKVKYLHQRGLMSLDLIDDMTSNLVSIHRGLHYSVSPQILFEQYLVKSIKTHYRLSQSAK